MSSTAPVLRAERLGRRVGDLHIVKDISFELWAGDLLAVTGPSGSGKSSLLRLLNRLDEPTEGTVHVGGRDYRAMAPRELRRRVGMVSQRPFLFPGSVAHNVAFGPDQRGEQVAEGLVAGLLGRVGLAGYEDRDVGHLSGGEAQRVSLARTLANSPEVLLLDEPTSALDERAVLDVERLICSVLDEPGLSGIVVTHDRDQAARMANRVMIVERGEMVRIGPTEEVLRA
ncbi:MAG TPA: ATP-binding cassette domain-containing protein [Actinomycetota bacterium]|nr:ATP-binding cassette domain-containing protein [Actinomycetota bacterium]